MAGDRLRIAVAGAGAFGREHLKGLGRRDDVAIVGVADPSTAATEAARRDFGADATFADAVAMLDATRPDGLIVATPGPTHVPLAAAALERNIPVLIEKPVGMTALEVSSLVATEARSSAFALPGHILRFWEPYRQMAEIVRSGALGPVLAVSGRKHRDEAHAARYTDTDPVLMTMIHDIDMMLWITGGVLGKVFAERNPADSFRSVTLVSGRDSTGALWSLSNAWTLARDCPPDQIEIVCARGAVRLEAGVSLEVLGEAPRTIDISAATADDMLDAELAHFAAGIRSGKHPGVVTLADARNGLAVADAIARSLRSGAVEAV